MAIKIDLDLSKFKQQVIQEYRKVVKKSDFQQVIVRNNIQKGVSPVKGKRFERYSDTYLNKIKKRQTGVAFKAVSPINMTLTGKMLKSFFLKKKPEKSSSVIGFDNDLADIHNRQGSGKSKTVRRLLPTNRGEEFNRDIDRFIFRLYETVIERVVKRQNR